MLANPRISIEAQAPVTAQRILAENPQICHVRMPSVVLVLDLKAQEKDSRTPHVPEPVFGTTRLTVTDLSFHPTSNPPLE